MSTSGSGLDVERLELLARALQLAPHRREWILAASSVAVAAFVDHLSGMQATTPAATPDSTPNPPEN